MNAPSLRMGMMTVTSGCCDNARFSSVARDRDDGHGNGECQSDNPEAALDDGPRLRQHELITCSQTHVLEGLASGDRALQRVPLQDRLSVSLDAQPPDFRPARRSA